MAELLVGIASPILLTPWHARQRTPPKYYALCPLVGIGLRFILLAVAAEEASHYDLEASGQPVTVLGDRTLLRRLVRNLVENARRYGGEGPVSVSVTHAGNRAVLEVTDRGHGVPEAERQRIFEPFCCLAGGHESGRGSGLGLALVLDIAHRHGGDAVCLAADGGGSRFKVDLPAA